MRAFLHSFLLKEIAGALVGIAIALYLYLGVDIVHPAVPTLSKAGSSSELLMMFSVALTGLLGGRAYLERTFSRIIAG